MQIWSNEVLKVSDDDFHLDEGNSDNLMVSERQDSASNLFDESGNLNSVNSIFSVICSKDLCWRQFSMNFTLPAVLGPITNDVTNFMDHMNSPLSSSNAMVTEETDSNIHAVLSTACEEASSIKLKLGATNEEKKDNEKSASVLYLLLK